MIRILVDTNVYVSALVFGGTPARLLQGLDARGVQLVTSREIEAELIETLRDKFGWSSGRAKTVCERLWASAYWASTDLLTKAVRDADDDHVVAAAVESGCEIIVTGDKDLLVLKSFRGIAILTPAALVERLRER